jgi:hypothetical protein
VGPQRGFASAGVGVVGVATVHEDVALVEQRHQFADHCVGGLARLDHHHDHPRPGEAGDELCHRLGRHERAFAAVFVN